MQFETLAAALEMGGHGGYVWAVYCITVLVVAFLLVGPALRSKRIKLERRGQLRREAAARQKETGSASGT